MNTAKKFFAQNKALTFLVWVIWLSACVCGILCAARLGGDGFDNVREYVINVIDNGASVWEIIKLGLSENLKFLICLLITSSVIFFLPLTLALVAFKGFAAGFTAAIIIKIYKLNGIFISFGTVVLPFVFSLPMYFMMFVAALRFPMQNHKERLVLSPHEKRQMWFSYAAAQLVLMLLICAITVVEAFLSQLIFRLAAKA